MDWISEYYGAAVPGQNVGIAYGPTPTAPETLRKDTEKTKVIQAVPTTPRQPRLFLRRAKAEDPESLFQRP